MKKIITLLLCAVLLLGLFAGCSGSGEGESGGDKIATFSVGYAKAGITPRDSVPLRGYGDAMQRFSTGNLEPLYATCVAFADAEGTKMLFITHDLTNSADNIFVDLRKQISEETGIPVSHILVSASHSHSSPDYSQAVPTIATYIADVKSSILQGAKDALADLSPATMRTGYERVDKANTTRHYLLADGSYQGKSVGTVPKDQLIGHHSKVDNLLQVVEFAREDKKDVVLVNWCGHPMGVGDDLYTLCGPNYPGILRQELEAKYDVEVAFVLSGSGNVNNGSQIAGDVEQKSYVELGERLASVVGGLLEGNMTAGKVDKIHLEENLYMAMGKSGYEIEIPLYAFSVGDWACVTAPFEIFDTNVMAVRDASKYKMTFYASCANISLGYLPTPASYDWAITYEAGITKFPKGTAEMVQDQLIQMLDRIFTASGNEVLDKGEGYNTPEFVPSSDGTVYMNPAPGDLTKTKQVQNGFYSLILLKGTGFKNMLAIDQATAEKVLACENMQLVLNEQSVIVDEIPQ